MKTLLVATALGLMAGAAYAGEGNGDPFAYRAAPFSMSMQGYKQAKGSDQNPYPFNHPGSVVQPQAMLNAVGSQQEVQTANSLPAAATPVTPNVMVAQPNRAAAPRG